MIDPELRDEGPAADTNHVLRQFAALWLVLFGGLAALNAFLWHRTIAAVLLATLAAGTGIPGLVRPTAIRPVFHGAMVVARPLGWVMSHALLALVFYGLFTPVGWLLRMFGHDALHRRDPANRYTYWVLKPRASDVRSYFRLS
jgi:Saxitoxin biosynthesis operon protein SxtJ